MKSDSSLFDNIRVTRKGSKKKAAHNVLKDVCEWDGCEEKATHKAPKGRTNEGKFYHFCMVHVQEYNKTYNYFEGMNNDSIRSFQKEAQLGHRPTWTMGHNPATARKGDPVDRTKNDPFHVFDHDLRQRAAEERMKNRHVGVLAKRAFTTLGVGVDADKETIKASYKQLVKKHHPDVNGGDRASEERLQSIIQAYNLLKANGFC